MNTFRKTREGEWAIIGDAVELNAALKAGKQVEVTKKNGEASLVTLRAVSKAFGDGLAYGYLASDGKRGGHRSGGSCDNCGRHSNSLVNAYDLSGIPGRVCYSCNRDRYALSFA